MEFHTLPKVRVNVTDEQGIVLVSMTVQCDDGRTQQQIANAIEEMVTDHFEEIE